MLLMAATAGVAVCPHAGGVGLCEYVSHIAPFDYIAVSGSLDGRMCEWADHLHEHFEWPVSVAGGRYRLPERAGLRRDDAARFARALSVPRRPRVAQPR